MLKLLRIQNFAIIDSVAVEFKKGLNILSGETGAGKSIIMDALMLILGGRASTDLIRKGAAEATVEALFEIGENKNLTEILELQGLGLDDGELIVRRVVQASGKNRIFINGNLVNSGTLTLITSQLVDLCGQHDQQLLTKPEEQLLRIDRFGDLEELRLAVKKSYSAWKEKQKVLEELQGSEIERSRRIDFLRFQIQELEEASLTSASEDTEIEQELKTLSNAEALFAFAQEGETAVYGSDIAEASPISDSVGSLLNKVKNLIASDPKLQLANDLLGNIKVSVDELGYFFRQYAQTLSRDEGRLDALNARSSLLTKLKRKYGPSLADVILSQEKFKNELSLLENHETSMQQAVEEEKRSLRVLEKFCTEISEKRTQAAKKFSRNVEKELADLNMDRAKFEVSLQPLSAPSITGGDSIRFMISANPGEPLNTLQKIASGGELSRVMLAIHNVISGRGGVGVYLFDEVDAGIGGKTASSVGAKIQKVSRLNQVICITHLPQVAAYADAQFRVEKKVAKKSGEERTICSVIPLAESERVTELARMLGGMENDKSALETAKTMLAKARTSYNQAKELRI